MAKSKLTDSTNHESPLKSSPIPNFCILHVKMKSQNKRLSNQKKGIFSEILKKCCLDEVPHLGHYLTYFSMSGY